MVKKMQGFSNRNTSTSSAEHSRCSEGHRQVILTQEQASGQINMSGVWSCNEWDLLEEVIVGNPLNARYPTPDRSTQLAEFPDRSLAEIPRGPFPQQIIEETEEDLNGFAKILEGLGITVKRPDTWSHDGKFSTIHWEAQGVLQLLPPRCFVGHRLTTLSKRPMSSAAAPRKRSAISKLLMEYMKSGAKWYKRSQAHALGLTLRGG